ncbi:MAG: response regulator [Candidatus Eisenbacteria bacterium]|nr:response regulator [Candidatus Eisenbacteria bacterium]
MPATILIVEDDDSLRRVAEFNLTEDGYRVVTAEDGLTALERFEESEPAVVLSDIRMPGKDGLELLREIKRRAPATEVILMTAYGTIEQAVEAMREGAFDFVTKPVRWEEVKVAVARALEHRRLVADNERLRAELAGRFQPEAIIGDSPALRAALEIVERVAPADAPLLILGESGTGKELVARAVHFQSARRDKPFVAINCAAIPRDLLEAELFGVRKGAFTGADRDREGRFAEAQGGTLFLDEVAELPAELQVKLLRALQEGQVTPLGGGTPVELNARLVSATNRPEERLVDESGLRKDLYYRINVVSVTLPPLRDRPEDIPDLVRHFLHQHGAPQLELSPEALRALQSYAWPGNVRELENVVERAILLRADPRRIDHGDLPPEIREAGPGASSMPDLPPGGWDMQQLEQHLIRRALKRTGGNQTRAASLLGMTRQTLVYRMQKHDIGPGDPGNENGD